jgi:hypothetical protein
MIRPGNVNHRTPVRNMVKGITAKLIRDKGYISQDLLQDLLKQGTTLITKIKKNMKNYLIDMTDKIMLLKRSLVETIFSSMKSLKILIPTQSKILNATRVKIQFILILGSNSLQKKRHKAAFRVIPE